MIHYLSPDLVLDTKADLLRAHNKFGTTVEEKRLSLACFGKVRYEDGERVAKRTAGQCGQNILERYFKSRGYEVKQSSDKHDQYKDMLYLKNGVWRSAESKTQYRHHVDRVYTIDEDQKDKCQEVDDMFFISSPFVQESRILILQASRALRNDVFSGRPRRKPNSEPGEMQYVFPSKFLQPLAYEDNLKDRLTLQSCALTDTKDAY